MLTSDQAKAFLGVGWQFQPCVAPDGKIALAQYEEDVREAILIILGTNLGERVMRPTFGAGLNQFVFEPLNATTINLVQTRVQEALIAWEPRINVIDVTASAGGDEANQLLISLTYQIRATNTQFNLVYPFYLQEGSAG
jgi:phage baseplate assembly protein W